MLIFNHQTQTTKRVDMKFKHTTYQDVANIIEEAVDEGSRTYSGNLGDSVKKVFDLIDVKLMEFFDE